jgi:CRP/FNR family transcriptional regulator, cyclic AMP receptor protein
VLRETLRSGRLAARARALPVLRALPDGERLLEELVDHEVATSLRLVVMTEALRGGGADAVVLRRLRERIEESAHTALLLIAAVLQDERIGRVSDLLRSAGEGRDRAALLEALESALPDEDAAQLLPLLDRERPRAIAARAARTLGGRPPSFDEAVTALVTDGDRLTAALLRGTLDARTRARLRLDPDRTAVPYEGGAAAVAPAIETLLLLRSVDLFERLTTQQLADLAAAVKEVDYVAGAAIVTEGEWSDGLFVVVEGEVLLTRAGIPLRTHQARGFFGEMSLLDGETRSATATAVGPARLLWLSREAVIRIMEEQPAIAIAISQTLSRRVRELLLRPEMPLGSGTEASKKRS